VVIAVWLLSSLRWPEAGPVALVAGALGIPYLPVDAYYAFIAEPAFRRAVRVGASRASIRAAAHRWAHSTDRADEGSGMQQGLPNEEYAIFPVRDTFCVEGDHLWTIRFDRQNRVRSWTVTPSGSAC
jgi:hypothetical protein